MKIGILTLHYGSNYGGVLQCYAMQEFLMAQGHQVEIINFIPTLQPSLIKRISGKLRTISSLHDLMHNLSDFTKVKKNRGTDSSNNTDAFKRIFNDFRLRRLFLSEKVDETTISNLSENYDAVIVGSDQVWTALYGKRHVYFLDWIQDGSATKRISYAACSAHSFARGATKHRLAALVEKLDAIGVRDTTTFSLIKSLNPALEPTLVADPTMLHDFNDFASDAPCETPYIITYILGTEINGGHRAALTKIKEQAGNLKVISIIVPESASAIEQYSDIIISDATPEQWVSLIRHAAVVYTDSFHGIMFSLKFGKPLFAYYANAIRASRLTDLKERFPSLPIYSSVPDTLSLDYDCDCRPLIESSKAFIQKSLEI